MNNLNRRVEKLEQKRPSESDGKFWPNKVCIFYRYKHADGDAGEAEARAAAVTKWEVENGPLGDIEPNFVAFVGLGPASKEKAL